MKDKIVTLFIVFILQICLAIGIYFNKKNVGAFSAEEGFLGFDEVLVDKIQFEDNEEKTNLVIKKENDTWVLPDFFHFPASAEKMERFIKKFSTMKKSWPVARTKSTAKRFKVEENNFGKKITFSLGNNKSSSLLLGTSPSFKKVHARIPDEDEIYTIKFSSYEVDNDPENWMDRKFLKLKRNEIELVEMPSFLLFEKEGKLVIDDINEKEEIVEERAKDLLSKITDISFRGILGKEEKPEYRQSSPKLLYNLKMKSGKKVSYNFSQPKDKDYFVLKVSSHDYFFKVDKYEVEKFNNFKREGLVRVKKEEKITKNQKAPS